MPNFTNAKLYRLIATDGSFYIGSSCSSLSKRYSEHKANSDFHPEQRRYKHFRELGWDNVKIELIRACPCENSLELRGLEDAEIRPHLGSELCMNVKGAILDRVARAAYHRGYSKSYYETNKEAVKERMANRYKAIKEAHKEKHTCVTCGGHYRLFNEKVHLKSKRHQKAVDSIKTET